MLRITVGIALLAATTIQVSAQQPWGPPRSGKDPSRTQPNSSRLTPDAFIRQFEADHLPERLIPKETASELQRERAHSLALFGQARLKQQQEEYDEALRAFQRAYQWNPSAGSILWEIVPLAFYLDRHGEAIRYAILANEKLPRDPELMQQLAMMLASDNEYGRARDLMDSAVRIHQERDLLLAILHFDRARICLFKEDYRAAADSLDIVRSAIDDPAAFDTTAKALRDRLGDETVWHTLAAEVYLQAGRMAEATEAFEALNASINSPAIHSFHRARLAVQAGTWDVALEELNAYFESHSNQAGEEPYELLEDVFLQKLGEQRGRKELHQRLSQLVTEDPANDELAMFVARKLRKRNQHAQVVELLQPLVANSVSLEAMEMLLQSQIELEDPGAIFTSLGQLTTQWKRLRGRFALPMSEAIDKLLKNENLLQQVVEEATERLDDRRRPMVATESFTIAQLCLRAKELDAADRFFRYTLENTRDEDARDALQLTWAEECYFADHLAPAIAGFEHALQRLANADSPDGVTELLVVALELDGQTQRAQSLVTQALDRSPDSPELALRRAWVFLHADQHEQAIEAYRNVIETYGDQYDSEATRQSVKSARMTLSSLYVDEGDPAASSALLLAVLDEYPEDVGAQNDLGYLWADEGIHLHRALHMIEQAVDAEPENAAYLDSLGWVYYRLERLREALPPLLKAVESMEEPDGVILDHLGDVYNSMDDRDNALTAWRNAVQQFKQAESAQEADRVSNKIERAISVSASD